MSALRIGHFIHQLDPFGSERLLETLLKYRSEACHEQFVVGLKDGPMRHVYEALGIDVLVTKDVRLLTKRLREADVVNLHLLEPGAAPPCLTGRLGRPKIVTIHWAAAFPAAMADRFVATSTRAFELQPEQSRCELIPNGVDLDRYSGDRINTNGRRIISRISRPQKCHEMFWYALLPVLADYPDTELWLAGTEATSSRRVRALGFRNDVPAILAASYLFVHAPPEDEGSRDLVVMEAMAMGTPCVLTDVPTVRESVDDDDVAHFVECGDGDGMAAAVRHLLDEPAEACALGERARAYAVANFDVRSRVREYERVYQEVA
jgi:glycosyltransferase involved in cell wall biosynthesis